MVKGIWVLGDQLWLEQAALQAQASSKEATPVILIESRNYVQQRPYHQQKLVLVWSAMRHFAEELKTHGWSVTYAIDDDFLSPLLNWLKVQRITELLIMTPNDRPFGQFIKGLSLPCQVTWVPNNHFLWSIAESQTYFQGRKRLLLEDFYRTGRRRFQVLMDNQKPVGGQWNFDKANRKPPKSGLTPPEPLTFAPDAITQAVMQRVKILALSSYGELEPFNWAVTRQQALQVLRHFIQEGLPNFGTYQDAMVISQGTLWHSLLSPYLNLGLLRPWEVIQSAENAYYQNKLPLNGVEGFIRQVLGWREYINGLYHFLGDDYPQSNWFEHENPLPSFYWDSQKTNLNCLRQVLSQVERTGYAHHIQRLMVLNNFALITGVSPQALENWFHAAFIDSHDWVMQTNVLGMGQFADGGILASKPYASSANYLHKMSDFCSQCIYSPQIRTGEKACPFNYFYWDFLQRHQEKLSKSGRMALVLGNLQRIELEEMAEMQKLADQWLGSYS
jgi:deoxyribodipyrimidine photolyase-related protein